MVKNVKLFTSIPGYNPPENYLILQTNTHINNLALRGYYTAWEECKHSIDNNMGTVIVKSSPSFYRIVGGNAMLQPQIVSAKAATIVWVKDDVTSENYFGVINSIREIAAGILEIKYTVDWYTSQTISAIGNLGTFSHAIAETIMYKRKADGEFNYVDEGMIPRKVSDTQYELMTNASGIYTSLFSSALNDNYIYACLLVYHDSTTDTDHWFIHYTLRDGSNLSPYPDPALMWSNYCTSWNINPNSNSRTFNPKNVHYYGYINLYPENIPYSTKFTTSDYKIYVLNDVHTLVDGTYNKFGYTYYKTPKSTGTCQIYDKSTLTVQTLAINEYSRFVIRDLDYNELYAIPLGLTVKGFKYTASIAFSANPYITFEVTSFIASDDSEIANDYTGYTTFSVNAKPLEFYIDEVQVYNAEDRIYQQELRNLQTVNDFVSGMTGAAQQGAMVSAFSRNQTSTGTSKGVIAGGVAAVGQFFSTGYQFLYANKEAQRIEDDHYRRKADALLMSGSNPFTLCDLAGGYLVSYDSVTIAAIQAYQSRFGYQTNAIGSNVYLNTLSGYVQAEAILQPGLRTEIESYIVDMFRNGVKFNAV